MAKAQSAPDQIEYTNLDRLFLDPKNPRLGRNATAKRLSQDQVLALMKGWTLEELATSFCESGFWPQEALIVVREKIDGQSCLVVVEGNRRLAALKRIAGAHDGSDDGWSSLIRGVPKTRLDSLRDHIPYIEMPDRDSVRAYLGFRHVTGIKEWQPAEKAQFIADLVEKEGLTYEQVRRKIGSKAPTVRQNYISYKLLLQMEDQSEKVDVEKVEERFSVLYLSLRSEGVRTYLHININADPQAAAKPVPPKYIKQLENFARWLFGDAKHEPLFTDSRKVDEFGKMLASEATVNYLERTEKPSFEVARRLSGVSEADVSLHVEKAADEAEEALRAAHMHKTSRRLKEAVSRLSLDTIQLLRSFPDLVQRAKEELN